MSKPGPKRSVDVGDKIIVTKLGSTFQGRQGTITEYIPSTSTAWGSYVRITFDDGSTRRFRPAEVEKVGERIPWPWRPSQYSRPYSRPSTKD